MASVFGMLARAVVNRPHAVAAMEGEVVVTWSSLWTQVHHIMAMLDELPSSHAPVVVVGRNSPAFLAWVFAAAGCARPLVPVNYRLTTEDIVAVVRDSGARVVASDAEYEGRLQAIVGDLVTAILPIRWHSGLPAQAPGPGGRVPGTGSNVCHIMYTSGTTGTAKGVMLTHTAVVSQSAQKVAMFGYDETTRYLSAAPLFHVAGLSATLSVAMAGGTQIFPASTGPADLRKAAVVGAVTDLVLVPTLLYGLVAGEEHQPPLDRVKSVVVGGGTPSPALVGAARRALPLARFSLTFACTEASSTIAVHPFAEPGGTREPVPLRQADGSVVVGRASLLVEVAILPSRGGQPTTEPKAAGEIVARGPTMMSGYLGRPQESQRALEGGWLHTGDSGYLDEAGMLHFFGRLTDMLKTGGENVLATEVEAVLLDHPGVADAAVVGVEDDRLGQRIVAVVVLRRGAPRGAPALEEIRAFCRTKLPGFKTPKNVLEYSPAPLPKTASGKVIKPKVLAFAEECLVRNRQQPRARL